MKRLASILAAIAIATAAQGQNLAAIAAGLMGSIPTGPATFPTNNLAIRFCAQDLGETAILTNFPSCGGGPVATNLSTPPIVTNVTASLKAVRRSGASTWAMGWTPGVAMSTNMSFYFICNRASGDLSVGFGRQAGTALPYSIFGYSDNNWNNHGTYYGVTQIVGRVLMIGHIQGTNRTIDVNGWQPEGAANTFSAGTLDQFGRIGSSVFHVNEWFEGGIYTQRMSAADVLNLKQYSAETYGTPTP